jgi:hypothetical protein
VISQNKIKKEINEKQIKEKKLLKILDTVAWILGTIAIILLIYGIIRIL